MAVVTEGRECVDGGEDEEGGDGVTEEAVAGAALAEVFVGTRTECGIKGPPVSVCVKGLPHAPPARPVVCVAGDEEEVDCLVWRWGAFFDECSAGNDVGVRAAGMEGIEDFVEVASGFRTSVLLVSADSVVVVVVVLLPATGGLFI